MTLPHLHTTPYSRRAQHAAPIHPPLEQLQTWGRPLVGGMMRPGGGVGIFEAVIGLVAMLATVGALALLHSSTHISLIIPTLLAVIPLLVVLRVVKWVDRWEPEPRSLLVVTFFWGTGVAVVVSLLLNTAVSLSVAETTGSVSQGSFISAVISAPIVEEAAKGTILLLLLWLRRGAIGGPVDGMVYAGVTAAGFAFTENIFYFVQYHDVLGQVFVMRAVLSPFTHAVFTSMTGIAIGAAAASKDRSGWAWMAPLGYCLAVMLHAAWNYAATVSGYYVLFTQIPILCVLLLLIHWLQGREMEVVARQLESYVAAGWLAPWEVALTTSAPHRKAASRWAKRHSKVVQRDLQDFRATLIQLGLLARSASTGRIPVNFRDLESQYLAKIGQKRTVLARIA